MTNDPYLSKFERPCDIACPCRSAAALPRAAPNDSLAALRALSEEELIALCS